MSRIRGYEATVTCPYNKSHLILKERFQTHLVKCAKNYPDVVLKKCPFNTVHLVSESHLNNHVINCENRAAFDLFKFKINIPNDRKHETTQPEAELPAPSCYDSSNNWDNENHVTYNPQIYAEKANVIRTLNVATPSEKKAFREAERVRMREFAENME